MDFVALLTGNKLQKPDQVAFTIYRIPSFVTIFLVHRATLSLGACDKLKSSGLRPRTFLVN